MRSDAQKTVLTLLEPLYAAEFVSGGWSIFLRQLMTVMESDIGIAVLLDREGRPLEFMSEGVFSEEMMRAYEAHFAAIDPWANKFLSAQHPFGKNVSSQELLSPREFEQSEYYNDFWRPNGDLFHTCGALIEVDQITLANVGLPRCRDRGAYDGADIAVLDAISPHLQTALRMRQRLKHAVRAAANAEAALDRIEDAMIIANARGHVLYANAAAESELSTGLRLTCRRGCLAAGSLVAQNEFEQAFSEASAISKLATIRPPAFTTLASKELDPKSRSMVIFYPLSGSRRLGARVTGVNHEESGCVLIIVGGSDIQSSARDVPGGLLRKAYGLTQTEARVALELSRGRSIEEIALRLQIGIGTVRVHLKHVFLKTGTCRQAQLVGLICRANPRTI